MKTLMEKALVEALRSYMEKKRMQQTVLAARLGWSASDLNDILRGRKNIGKKRQAFLEKKLGADFKQDLLLKISRLSDSERREPSQTAERKAEYTTDKYILTDMERGYVDKLLAILRGVNQQAKLAVKTNIDAFYACIGR